MDSVLRRSLCENQGCEHLEEDVKGELDHSEMKQRAHLVSRLTDN